MLTAYNNYILSKKRNQQHVLVISHVDIVYFSVGSSLVTIPVAASNLPELKQRPTTTTLL
jgi:hypothetical protein